MLRLTLAGVYPISPGVTNLCGSLRPTLFIPSTTRSATTGFPIRGSRAFRTQQTTWCDRCCFCVQVENTRGRITFNIILKLVDSTNDDGIVPGEYLGLQDCQPFIQVYSSFGFSVHFVCQAPPAAQQLSSPFELAPHFGHAVLRRRGVTVVAM